jgi:6-pyruvoyltetrahydropterin/6-carboxytetrahydropterin synthase
MVEDEFDAAHFLANYQGRCETLHGHTWRVQAVFQARAVEPNSGLAVDFQELKTVLKNILDRLDHSFLNENKLLKGLNPSCENLARLVYELVKKEFPLKIPGVSLSQVTVWESARAGVTYSET